VAKYIAVSTREASFDVRSMAKTSTQGLRHRGDGPARRLDRRGGGSPPTRRTEIPILILFPEVTFDKEKFLAKAKEKVEKFGYVTVVVSEGCKWPDGKFLAEAGTRDAFGHAQLGGAAPVVAQMVKDASATSTTGRADYLQRAARHLASKTDVDRPMRWARRRWSSPCRAATRSCDHRAHEQQPIRLDRGLGEPVRRRERREDDAHGVHHRGRLWASPPACREYLSCADPGRDYPPYKNGLPDYVTLKNVPSRRKLKHAGSSSDR